MSYQLPATSYRGTFTTSLTLFLHHIANTLENRPSYMGGSCWSSVLMLSGVVRLVGW